MTPSQIKKVVRYWQLTADHDYDTILALFKAKRYSDCLFFGHIALEKILKAHVVLDTKQSAPYIHNLVRLAACTQLKFTEVQLDLLDIVNDFNIRARYPEYKLDFYKKCTKSYTTSYLKQIIQLYRELCQQLQPKK